MVQAAGDEEAAEASAVSGEPIVQAGADGGDRLDWPGTGADHGPVEAISSVRARLHNRLTKHCARFRGFFISGGLHHRSMVSYSYGVRFHRPALTAVSSRRVRAYTAAMRTRIAVLAVAALPLVAWSCSSTPPGPLAVKDMPAINTNAVLDDIRKLSSDEFEGRQPGTKGEQLTVSYVTDRFKDAGAEPGNPDGSWTQQVPLVGLNPAKFSPLTLKKGGQTLSFKQPDDVIAFTQRVTDAIAVKDSDVIFAGYGVQAPEYNWDDFKGVDVKGKTIIVLVNDPPVPDPANPSQLDPKTFGGKAMTLYGRWTYKYDKAAELGAAAIFIVHETPFAGYGWNVVQGFGGERFDLVTPDKNMGRAAIQGWITQDAATKIFKAAGLDFATLKKQAGTRDFTPVPLKMAASMSFSQTLRTVESHNVIAKITGADPQLKNEYVIYTAHWDHLGVGTPVNGDNIYNGARDNASGTAMLIEFAREFKKVQPAPKRTIVFLAVTSEEQGLLGSEYYSKFPLYPLNKTLAEINMDEINVWGKTSDITVIGLGQSDLDDYAKTAAAEQGRTLTPDAEPEKGLYYRSDHYNFAKAGVPAFDPDSGLHFVGKPDNYGQQKRDEWTEKDYHQPSDQIKDWWDLSGAAEDGQLLFAIGYRVANADSFPQWKPGSEFKAARDKSMAGGK
jgi:Zn-dependent M28 family amino/carboxypeptidase